MVNPVGGMLEESESGGGEGAFYIVSLRVGA